MESETTGARTNPRRPPEDPAVGDEPDADGTTETRESDHGGARRAVGWAMVGTGALASAAAGMSVVTRYARLLTDPPNAAPEDPPSDDDRITLHVVGPDHVVASGAGAARPGVWGVATADGYGRMGDIAAMTESGARRPFVHLDGVLQPAHGVLDAYAHVNRATDLHPAATEVLVAGEVGDLPAHRVLGDDVWAIGVHGRAAARHETFRMLGPIVAAGHSAMAISYRNDRDAPPSPDGRSHLGGTEWGDVAAAMDHARANGATRIVLIGCSMGGAVVGQTLARADVHDVVGIILDSPVVDWSPVAAKAAQALGMPRVVVSALMAPTRALARQRHQVDLAQLRLRPELLDVPTLVVHGVDDPVVPITGSDVLATARPDTVSMLRVPDAAHVRSWNADPATYECAVIALLERALAAGDSGANALAAAPRSGSGSGSGGAAGSSPTAGSSPPAESLPPVEASPPAGSPSAGSTSEGSPPAGSPPARASATPHSTAPLFGVQPLAEPTPALFNPTNPGPR